jgi:hypothetical protein
MWFFLLVPALLFALPPLLMLRNLWQVRGWQTASAEVISAELRRMRFPRSRAVSYRPLIRYRYTVHGTEYQSGVYAHGMEVGVHKPKAQRLLERYPPGSTITVKHHPTQPERACITVRFDPFGWVLALLSLLLFVLAFSL